MCTFAAALAGIQAGAQIAGGIYQNKAAKAAAKQAEMEGRYAQAAAASEAEQIRYNNQRDLGSLRAAFGPRGVTLDSASMVDVLAEAAGNLDLAAIMKEHEGLMGRYSAGVRAKQLRDRGQEVLYKSILGAATGFAAQGINTGWWANVGGKGEA